MGGIDDRVEDLSKPLRIRDVPTHPGQLLRGPRSELPRCQTSHERRSPFGSHRRGPEEPPSLDWLGRAVHFGL